MNYLVFRTDYTHLKKRASGSSAVEWIPVDGTEDLPSAIPGANNPNG